jgi:hypothetical protein
MVEPTPPSSVIGHQFKRGVLLDLSGAQRGVSRRIGIRYEGVATGQCACLTESQRAFKLEKWRS